jgi:hypothetical protein
MAFPYTNDIAETTRAMLKSSREFPISCHVPRLPGIPVHSALQEERQRQSDPELWEGPVAEYLNSLTDAAKKE